jgi:hypothetical protein
MVRQDTQEVNVDKYMYLTYYMHLVGIIEVTDGKNARSGMLQNTEMFSSKNRMKGCKVDSYGSKEGHRLSCIRIVHFRMFKVEECLDKARKQRLEHFLLPGCGAI